MGGNDYFCPEEINKITAVPFIWVRADKAGKHVNEKFATKYYSKFGYGVRLIAETLISPNNNPSWYIANSLDNTTYIKQCDNQEELPLQDLSFINKIIQNISKYTTFNTGDYITYDLVTQEQAITPINSQITYKGITITII